MQGPTKRHSPYHEMVKDGPEVLSEEVRARVASRVGEEGSGEEERRYGQGADTDTP